MIKLWCWWCLPICLQLSSPFTLSGVYCHIQHICLKLVLNWNLLWEEIHLSLVLHSAFRGNAKKVSLVKLNCILNCTATCAEKILFWLREQKSFKLKLNSIKKQKKKSPNQNKWLEIQSLQKVYLRYFHYWAMFTNKVCGGRCLGVLSLYVPKCTFFFCFCFFFLKLYLHIKCYIILLIASAAFVWFNVFFVVFNTRQIIVKINLAVSLLTLHQETSKSWTYCVNKCCFFKTCPQIDAVDESYFGHCTCYIFLCIVTIFIFVSLRK